MREAERNITIGYHKHLKTGNFYFVDGLSYDATNGGTGGNIMVRYHSLGEIQISFVRKIEEFLDGRFVPKLPLKKENNK